MKMNSAYPRAMSFCACLALPLTSPASPQVDAGYDLLAIQPGTTFEGIDFTGVPLGTYDFGGSIGTVSVGNADAVVQRLQDATPSTPTIDIRLDALQLVSTAPVTFGGAADFYYLTLRDTPTVGRMTFNFSSGACSSFFDVFFDIRLDSPTGPVIQSGELRLENSGTSWADAAPSSALLINGINNDLNGVNTTNDFWAGNPGDFPPGLVVEEAPDGSRYVAADATAVPEPTTAIAGMAMLLPLAAGVSRSLHRKHAARTPSTP